MEFPGSIPTFLCRILMHPVILVFFLASCDGDRDNHPEKVSGAEGRALAGFQPELESQG